LQSIIDTKHDSSLTALQHDSIMLSIMFDLLLY
jgi:hypothetical protein